jgi:hypothetical protein
MSSKKNRYLTYVISIKLFAKQQIYLVFLWAMDSERFYSTVYSVHCTLTLYIVQCTVQYVVITMQQDHGTNRRTPHFLAFLDLALTL